MNPTLAQLIQQAGTDTTGKWMRMDQVELLANSIVQICADTAYQAAQHDLKGVLPDSYIPLRLQVMIANTFGVTNDTITS